MPASESLTAMLRLLASLIMPRTCSGCGNLLESGPMCAACLMLLPRTECHLAPANRLREYVSNGVAPVGFTAAWFLYDPSAARAEFIRQAKYGHRPRQARALGRVFAAELLADATRTPAGLPTVHDVDLLLPIPIHRRKLLMRGYNQAAEIARGISEATGIPVGDNLRAAANHSTQTLLGAEERRRNIAGCFAVDYPEELEGLRIALVDDIVTTGATLSECTLTLSRSGARPAAIGAISLALTEH